jgi:hypothetical protein
VNAISGRVNVTTVPYGARISQVADPRDTALGQPDGDIDVL